MIPEDKLSHLGNYYTDAPIMRALASLVGVVIPGTSVLDEFVVAQWQKAKNERFHYLLEELLQGNQVLTEELIQREDFIFAFVAVSRASIFSKQREKIRLFAQVLKSACRWEMLDSDDFEENLQILDDLSLHELKLLLLYKKHEDRLHERQAHKYLSAIEKSQWDFFAQEAEDGLGVAKENLDSALMRLTRTGLYQFVAIPSTSNMLGSGHTTPRCKDFLNWVIEDDTNSR